MVTGTSSAEEAIAFIDLDAQRRRLGDRIEEAVLRVVRHGAYIMGPEVAELEEALSAFCGAKHAITCANGTDALALSLMAKGIGPGDAVFCPSFTFAATAEVVAWVGATPVFVDVLYDTFNLDPHSLEAAAGLARREGLIPRAVIPVDLFGQPADYDAIESVCADHELYLIADAAQSFGASYKERSVGTIGSVAATSFFPAKPLGCYGDGGALFTDDDDLAALMRSLRVHGQGTNKYDNVRVGINGRLDTIQAAVLLEKLKIFPEELARRRAVAERYHDALNDVVAIPRIADGVESAWAQYTVRIGQGRRDAFCARLKAAGIPTAIYYPKPLHRQQAYSKFPTASENGCPTAERLALEVVSLPMHPYLEPRIQDRITNAVRVAVAGDYDLVTA